MTDPRCTECSGPSQMGLRAEGKTLWYCIACAKRLAASIGLPSVAAAAQDAERRLAQRGQA